MSIIFWAVLFPLAIFFGLGSVMGAPYLPTRKGDREELLDLVNLKPGQTIIDLGSGDGAFLKAAAQRGIRAIGYEINPVLWAISYARCFHYRKLVTVRLGDFWRKKLPKVDVVYVFLIDRYMAKLADKLGNEVSTPTDVISYVFELPGQKPIKSTRNAYLYTIQPSST